MTRTAYRRADYAEVDFDPAEFVTLDGLERLLRLSRRSIYDYRQRLGISPSWIRGRKSRRDPRLVVHVEDFRRMVELAGENLARRNDEIGILARVAS